MAEAHPGDRFGYVAPDGGLILDGASARLLNEIRAEIRRLSNLVGVPPVNVSEDGSGRRISLDITPPIIARVSGSSNPYSFTEQTWDGGAWIDLPGGRTGTNAFEVNAKTAQGGYVVRLFYSLVGDWRFYNQMALMCRSCCAPPPGGCNGSLAPTSFNATLPPAVRLSPSTVTTVLTFQAPPSGASAVWSRDVLTSGSCFAPRLVAMPAQSWFSPAFPDPNTSGLGRMYYIYFYITGCAPTFKYLFYLPDATSLPSPWNICDDWGGQRSGGAVPFPQPVTWSSFVMTDCHQGLAADARYVVSGIGNGTMSLDGTGSLGKFA
jgi:hypothetical protein